MIEDEAKIVINIMMTADGDCYNCARNLIEKFKITFPQFKDLADKLYNEKYSWIIEDKKIIKNE